MIGSRLKLNLEKLGVPFVERKFHEMWYPTTFQWYMYLAKKRNQMNANSCIRITMLFIKTYSQHVRNTTNYKCCKLAATTLMHQPTAAMVELHVTQAKLAAFQVAGSRDNSNLCTVTSNS
jgi:hypothetical protein